MLTTRKHAAADRRAPAREWGGCEGARGPRARAIEAFSSPLLCSNRTPIGSLKGASSARQVLLLRLKTHRLTRTQQPAAADEGAAAAENARGATMDEDEARAGRAGATLCC